MTSPLQPTPPMPRKMLNNRLCSIISMLVSTDMSLHAAHTPTQCNLDSDDFPSLTHTANASKNTKQWFMFNNINAGEYGRVPNVSPNVSPTLCSPSPTDATCLEWKALHFHKSTVTCSYPSWAGLQVHLSVPSHHHAICHVDAGFHAILWCQ